MTRYDWAWFIICLVLLGLVASGFMLMWRTPFGVF